MVFYFTFPILVQHVNECIFYFALAVLTKITTGNTMKGLSNWLRLVGLLPMLSYFGEELLPYPKMADLDPNRE